MQLGGLWVGVRGSRVLRSRGRVCRRVLGMMIASWLSIVDVEDTIDDDQSIVGVGDSN